MPISVIAEALVDAWPHDRVRGVDVARNLQKHPDVDDLLLRIRETHPGHWDYLDRDFPATHAATASGILSQTSLGIARSHVRITLNSVLATLDDEHKRREISKNDDGSWVLLTTEASFTRNTRRHRQKQASYAQNKLKGFESDAARILQDPDVTGSLALTNALERRLDEKRNFTATVNAYVVGHAPVDQRLKQDIRRIFDQLIATAPDATARRRLIKKRNDIDRT